MTQVRQEQEVINYIDNVFPYTYPCSGPVPFTGPEGLRDYRAHLVDDPQAVGIGAVSFEQTLNTAYVLRAAPGATLERPRSCRPGEIGWGIPYLVDWAPPNTGQQIMLGDFRQMAEDRTTHEGTGAWYPHPEQQTPPGSDGYYKENIFSGRPGTSNVRYGGSRSNSPWRPSRSRFSSGRHGSRQAYRSENAEQSHTSGTDSGQ